MNQGRIWTVVHPTVGLPLFLGSVAITSLIVHASILTHTNWMSGYWAGSKARAAAAADLSNGTAVSKLDSGYTVSVLPAVPGSANAGFTITVTPSAETAKVEDKTMAPFKSASTQ